MITSADFSDARVVDRGLQAFAEARNEPLEIHGTTEVWWRPRRFAREMRHHLGRGREQVAHVITGPPAPKWHKEGLGHPGVVGSDG